MIKKEKVCAVIVTYNRKSLLLECINAVINQTRTIDGICIIDNASTDGTPELLLEKKYIKELPPNLLVEPWERVFSIPLLLDKSTPILIQYVRMNENVGGAGGFYEGIRRAYEMGYDWFWLMDDDAEPDKSSLNIMEPYFGYTDIAALINSKVQKGGSIINNHVGFFNLNDPVKGIIKPIDYSLYTKKNVEVDFSSFVGILLRRSAIEKAGFPKKEFFIHHDDVEYCIRLRKIGRLLLIPKSIILHKAEKRNVQVKNTLIKKTRRVPYEKYWILYYRRRNLVWLVNKYCKNKINLILFYMAIITTMVKKTLGIFLFDDNKMRRIQFLITAYFDGIMGIFDNTKPKKILYGK